MDGSSLLSTMPENVGLRSLWAIQTYQTQIAVSCSQCSSNTVARLPGPKLTFVE